MTPFCTACPSCGKPDLYHVNFQLDRYAPDHKPFKGQRLWVAMTRDRAFAMAKLSVLRRKKAGPETDLVIAAVAVDYYRDGHGPDMRVEGYTEAL